jgi:2-succinyl-5-enolpyruvyl-6-hydroxy-3-cyclohexene-1-carboxylate synthase
MTAAIQTLWAEVIAGALADAGVTTVAVSPGSRSTPLVVALANEPRLELVTIIDERAAAFFALGVARATGVPAALACTSGSAAAHYLPALVEASEAGVPLVVLTANRPPELHDCGANQTIDQAKLYGSFVRAAFDLGAPVASALAMRAVRRKIVQAVATAIGPHPGPVHVDVPLRKPLEPAAPSTDDERALARVVGELRRDARPAPPTLAPDRDALAALADAIAREPNGLVVAGAMPARFERDVALALVARAGYPLAAEAGSQLRFGPRPGVTAIDHLDLIAAIAPRPGLIIQLGAEPVAASWSELAGVHRWVLAEHRWHDPESTANVIVGDVATSLRALREVVPARGDTAFAAAWRELEACAASAIDDALVAHPRSESAVMRAALDAADSAIVQIGNSLPIRVVDHVCSSDHPRIVITQRGASGIDGAIASAAGATSAGAPVLLVTGDVAFAHDLGGLVAARSAAQPLAILVVDNRGGQIFAGLPIARAGVGPAVMRHFLTPPDLDPAAIATALGMRAITAASPAAVASGVSAALGYRGVTVIHAPVAATGAHDVRSAALDALSHPLRIAGGAHD